VAIFIVVAVMAIFTELLGINYLVSNLIGVGIAFPFNYLVSNKQIWKKGIKNTSENGDKITSEESISNIKAMMLTNEIID
jgi:hypothetical protein